jgi:hypothetical protein
MNVKIEQPIIAYEVVDLDAVKQQEQAQSIEK